MPEDPWEYLHQERMKNEIVDAINNSNNDNNNVRNPLDDLSDNTQAIIYVIILIIWIGGIIYNWHEESIAAVGWPIWMALKFLCKIIFG